MPKGPKGRFVGQLPQFYGLWQFSKNKSAAKDLLLHISQKESIAQLVEASVGYDLPSFKSMYDLDTWKKVGPPVGTVYSYPPRGDEQTSIAGCSGAGGSRRPDLQPGDQHRDGGEVHAGQREARRRHQVGREGTRRHVARLRRFGFIEQACRPARGRHAPSSQTDMTSVTMADTVQSWTSRRACPRRTAHRRGQPACSASCGGARPSPL